MNIQLTNNTPAIVYPEPPAFVPRKTSRAWAAAGQIIEARKQGSSINKLAERFNVSWKTIEKIIKTNAPAIEGTPKAKMDKKLHLSEQQNLALQAELKTERKRSQKARDAYRAERDKAEMARQSYTGLAERSAANVERLQDEIAAEKRRTTSAREAYEGAKKSVGELSDKLYGTKGALETATKIVEDHEAQINELRETLELANAATNALQQKLDHAETEVTNARIAEQAAHDRLNDPSWANRWSKEAHDEFERRKQAELDLMAAEAQLERMAEKLAECRNRGFFARVFG
jgi:chromosome segregation ATPase